MTDERAAASDQTEICKSGQVMVGGRLRETAERHVGNTPFSSAKLRGDGADRDTRRPIRWKGIDAGRDRRKGKRAKAVCGGKVECGAITRGQQFLFARVPSPPDRTDSMNHVPGAQPITARDPCRTGFAAAERAAFGQQIRSGGAVNCAVDPAPAKQCAIGGVDDGVGIERGDVGDANVDARRTDGGNGKR